VINKCYPKDGYNRVMLYRAWNTSCPPLLPGMTIIHEIDQFLMINQLLYTHNFQDFFTDVDNLFQISLILTHMPGSTMERTIMAQQLK